MPINQKQNETGRSMVEILGTLAIMGILTIGGIAAYRYAVDKINANDIINEVRKRAITASQQRVLGQTISLKEYHENDEVDRIKGVYEIVATNDYKGDSGFFSLTVFDIPKPVCHQILKTDWKMPIETIIEGTVVDNITDCPADNNQILFAFQNTFDNSRMPTCGENICPTGSSCSGGECICQDGYTPCVDTCCSDGYICSSSGTVGECIHASGECTRNEDCKTPDGKIDSGKYCHISATQNTSTPSCYQNYTGVCLSNGTLPPPVYIEGLGNTYNGPGVNVLSSKNWCLSHGKKMVKFEQLDCYESGTEIPMSLNSFSTEQFLGCCLKGQVCYRGSGIHSHIIQELNQKYGALWFWLDTDGSKCDTFFTHVESGEVGIYSRSNHSTNTTSKTGAFCIDRY